MASPDSNKKSKAEDKNNTAIASKKPNNSGYIPLTLPEICTCIVALMDRVPQVEKNDAGVLASEKCHEWAAQLQAVIEIFNLFLSLVSAATYKWGTDRSGAAQSKLGTLVG